MRLMAIDYGSKRVGVASTDSSGQFALPRAVWQNDRELVNKVLKLKEEEGVERIVIGESKNFESNANIISVKIERFKKELEKKGVAVVLHPEIFTTVEARRLQGSNDMTDASAAALILKNYIESQN
ncbi:MAG: RuvX/YqgF family protein [bacterium]